MSEGSAYSDFTTCIIIAHLIQAGKMRKGQKEEAAEAFCYRRETITDSL